MKRNYKKGFFLSETMVVLAVVTIVLVSVFKIFSTTYIKYQENEKYNTINSVNALSSIKKYLESFGEVNTVELLNGNAFVEITNNETYDSVFYDSIKEEYDIDSIFIIDMSSIKTNLTNFNAQYKNYINSLPDSNNKILLINVKGNQFTSINITSQVPALMGNADDEYVVYIEPGEEFIDPGYTNWEGDTPVTTWESPLDTNTIGIYYLIYNFDNYVLRRKVQVIEKEYEFDYTGNVQEFIVPASATYQIELWGAQGATGNYAIGGKGAYVKGNIKLNVNNKLNIYVGGQSIGEIGGYNGGGNGTSPSFGIGGGGGTDVRYNGNSLSDRIIVAGGGGGSYNYSTSYKLNGGNAGGLVGEPGSATTLTPSMGGSQIVGGIGNNNATSSSGTFGAGGNTGSNGSGGGGGYYGGGGTYNIGGSAESGAGGSSYISGYTGCVAVMSDGTLKSGCTDGTTDNSCSIHFSNKVFTESTMKAGNEEMLTHNGTSTMIGNEGNGYAKITLVD